MTQNLRWAELWHADLHFRPVSGYRTGICTRILHGVDEVVRHQLRRGIERNNVF
jgi:hypothetical protein